MSMARMTGTHCARSLTPKAAACSGVDGPRISPPLRPRMSATDGTASALFNAAFSFSTIARGVPAGTNRQFQV
jgi:hypothetical protein